ncbi:DUF5004 domain-containing protein [Muricauda sp. 334s03]|uniref:DUF5004 domain-containing protein n=1 Tax=Flagellimonas yonaguniensis TaxID=3031325 RepID=A0ABT5Y373_9FLAO|nr:DUF5004 domain-containing protein [[Muricauda] yonaguniensis]MDF0717902.1 DUF5004 domain-containing protein [[Muricauda] yonaguniensis]
MKSKFLSIGTVFLVCASFISCNSDDSIECPQDFTGALSAAEEQLVGEWVLSSIVATEEVDLTDDDVDNPSTDLFGQYSDCQRDAMYIFGENRSYTYEQGQNAEDCDYQVETSGTWELVSQNLRLTASCSIQSTALVFNDDSTEFSFSQSYNVTDVNGNTFRSNVDFTYSLIP